MISRVEFYACLCIIAGILIYLMNPGKDPGIEAEMARIEIRDSIIQAQKDSAFNRAMKYELQADSLQALLNRKNLDLSIIHKRIENEKNAMLHVHVDSVLAYFQRSVTTY